MHLPGSMVVYVYCSSRIFICQFLNGVYVSYTRTLILSQVAATHLVTSMFRSMLVLRMLDVHNTLIVLLV